MKESKVKLSWIELAKANLFGVISLMIVITGGAHALSQKTWNEGGQVTAGDFGDLRNKVAVLWEWETQGLSRTCGVYEVKLIRQDWNGRIYQNQGD